MTLRIASVYGEVPEKISGADLLEIRIDSLDLQTLKDVLPKLLTSSPIPTILTCRSVSEGGMFEGDEEERIAMYEVALQCTHPPRYIDVEHESVKRHPQVLEILSSEQTGIILSWHTVTDRPKNLLKEVSLMQEVEGADVVKVVWRARSIRDNLEVFELLQSRQRPMIAMCMGEYGFMSRILAPKFGGFATYASIDGMENTAPGQPTLRELNSVYGFDAINEDTLVFGLIGNNVSHSASPTFHNAAFQAAGVNAVFLPLQIPEGWEHLKASVGELQHAESLHFSGAAVTIPHKEMVMRLATTSDAISKKVGASNTLTITNTTIDASNTDVIALDSLVGSASRVLILGGGGVARAAIVAMLEQGAEVFIATRRSEQMTALATEFSSHVATDSLTDIDTVVNCTPIGMEGGNDPSGDPVLQLAPWLDLHDSIRVIDTVYKPEETPLLARAIAEGCEVVRGIEMFRLQATAQQQIWAK